MYRNRRTRSDSTFLISFLVTIAISSCRAGPTNLNTESEKSGIANKDMHKLHIYISNQSFKVPLGDLTVELDGKIVVSEKLDVKSQHNWNKVELTLNSGQHTIKAYESNTNVSEQKLFEVNRELWLKIAFFYDDSGGQHKFYIGLSKEPIFFK
jgi:hypothetical protein